MAYLQVIFFLSVRTIRDTSVVRLLHIGPTSKIEWHGHT